MGVIAKLERCLGTAKSAANNQDLLCFCHLANDYTSPQSASLFRSTMPIMKILFITRKYPPSVGGMEQFAYDLSQSLSTKVDLELVAWGGRGRWKAVFIALPWLFIRAVI